MTFERVASLNYTKGKANERKRLTDGNGEMLPVVSILRGSKSFPVFLTTFSVINIETKKKISFDDYKKLSNDEKTNFKVYPKLQVYNVFNIDQTNIKESRPELYERLREENQRVKPEISADTFSFPALDEMIRNNEWLCPIHLRYQDEAYYSIRNDEIIVPEKNSSSVEKNFTVPPYTK